MQKMLMQRMLCNNVSTGNILCFFEIFEIFQLKRVGSVALRSSRHCMECLQTIACWQWRAKTRLLVHEGHCHM